MKDTTVKTKAADAITDLQAAQNYLAVTIAHFSKSHSTKDKQEMETARKNVERLQELYRAGRLRQLAAVSDRMARDRKGV